MKDHFSNNEIYSIHAGSCPLCSSRDIGQLYLIKRFKLIFNVDRCCKCGFIFMNPVFKDSIIKNFYSEDYYSGNANYSYQDERELKKYASFVWEKRIRKIHRYVKEGNILDIGSAFGGLLESAKKYYIPYGIDISEYAGNYVKKIPGCTIHIGTIDDHPFQDNFFSVITMIELIEHTKDPVSVINKCFKILKKNGVMVIQTANMDGLQAKVLRDEYSNYMPGHLSYFTNTNLSDLLKKTGFKKIKTFYPVEFGLLPKLKKSRYNFKSLYDYKGWIRIILYHMISKIHFRNFSMTSSMVIYAFK